MMLLDLLNTQTGHFNRNTCAVIQSASHTGQELQTLKVHPRHQNEGNISATHLGDFEHGVSVGASLGISETDLLQFSHTEFRQNGEKKKPQKHSVVMG